MIATAAIRHHRLRLLFSERCCEDMATDDLRRFKLELEAIRLTLEELATVPRAALVPYVGADPGNRAHESESLRRL